LTPQEAIAEITRRQAETERFMDAEKEKALAAVGALAKRYELRLVKWSLVNLAWTIVLAIASALWWLR
jgi:hypothetical protein